MGTHAARRTAFPRPASVWIGAGIGGGLLLSVLSLVLGWPTATAAPPATAASAAPPARATAARAGQSPEGIEWKSLSPAQRQWLAPLERDWSYLEAGQKLKWLEIAQRLPGMPASERQRIQDRMAAWARMTPTERGQARLRYLQARRTSPDDRGARWEDYQALPTDQKKQLAARAAPPPTSGAAGSRKPVTAKTTEKSNLVTSPNPGLPPKPVAPTVIQARPGATTTLVSKQPSPPPHQQIGLPKIAATPGFIDKETLLPRRGPQGAATLSLDTPEPDAAPAPRP